MQPLSPAYNDSGILTLSLGIHLRFLVSLADSRNFGRWEMGGMSSKARAGTHMYLGYYGVRNLYLQ